MIKSLEQLKAYNTITKLLEKLIPEPFKKIAIPYIMNYLYNNPKLLEEINHILVEEYGKD
ncbi:MAG: hypothetical protein QXG39_04790 [Candidatus Aenigmatarchaeota archaeon]